MKVTYQSTAEARATAGNIPVFCAFDKLIDPKDLVGNPRNPNQHPADQIHLLAHIIQSQGWRAPITVSNQSGFVVRGHGRLAAALEFGAECVPVDYQNYSSEAEEWADLIADNRLAELSEIDNTKIADLIAEMDTGEVPVILSGYTEDEIANLLTAIAGDGDSEADGAGSKMHITEKPPKDKKSRYLRVEKGKGVYLYSEGKENTLWEVNRETGTEHPTQKPVELAQRAIENSTQEGEIVLDLFGGSGTTLIGAELTRRTAFLTEVDPKYVDVIVSRYARITGNVAGICVRDGKEIPYATLKQEWEAANGRESGLR